MSARNGVGSTSAPDMGSRVRRPLAVGAASVMVAFCVGSGPASAAVLPSQNAGGPATQAVPAVPPVPPTPDRAAVLDVVPRRQAVVPVSALLQPKALPVALSDARVRVYALRRSGDIGPRLGVGRTGSRGAASVRLDTTPSRLLVKVTGGRTSRAGSVSGRRFHGSLTTVVARQSQLDRHGVVRHSYGSAAASLQSTVLTAYAAPRPAKKWRQAKAKVSKFLGLPHHIKAFEYDYNFDVYNQRLFNSASFLAQAGRSGGVDRFVAKLSRDIAAGKKPHPFPRPSRQSRSGVQASGVLTGPTASALSNVSSIADGVTFVAKLGFSLYDIFTGQTKSDNEANLKRELQQINGQLAEIITALGTLQASIDNVAGQISQAGADTATTGTTTDVGAIKSDWTQHNLVVFSALQVCDISKSACAGPSTLFANITSTCTSRDVPSSLVTNCDTFIDNLTQFNALCSGAISGTPAIQSATINLAELVGGEAAGGSSGSQGVINNVAQSVSSSNLNVISPSGLDYIDQTWTWYYYLANLGDALDAAYLSMQLGGPLPGEHGTTVTTEYIQGQINTEVAPTMNRLAGTFPSMPLGTALSSNSGGGGTAYLWPTQIGMNASQAYDNNDMGSTQGSPWVFNTNSSNQVTEITNLNDGSNLAFPVVADQTAPVVSTLLPDLAPGVKACATSAPPTGTCTALIIGQNASGNPTFQTKIDVTSGPIPSWQVPSDPAFDQLADPFQSANPSGLDNDFTLAQWLTKYDGFNEDLLAQGGGFNSQTGVYAFVGKDTGNNGFFGGCTPAGNTDCHLLTWSTSSGTGVYDLNNGQDIGTQSGNWGPGCSGGGFGGGDWTNFSNWTSNSNLLITWNKSGEWNNLPCGMVYWSGIGWVNGGYQPGADVYAMPLWNQLNGVNNAPMPDPPYADEYAYPVTAAAPYVNPDGLRMMFTAPIDSGYCFASYSAGTGTSSNASACMTPRTEASQVIPVPTGS